jgi:hypothetical protein
VLETLGYRQIVLLWRLEGFWQLVKCGEWGAMERKGFETPEIAGTVRADVGYR